MPERDLNILFEIAAQIGVGLTGAGKPRKRAAEPRDGVDKSLILFRFGYPKSPANITV